MIEPPVKGELFIINGMVLVEIEFDDLRHQCFMRPEDERFFEKPVDGKVWVTWKHVSSAETWRGRIKSIFSRSK